MLISTARIGKKKSLSCLKILTDTTSMPLDLFFIEHNIDDTSREVTGSKKNEFGTSTGKYVICSSSLQAGNESAMTPTTNATYSLKLLHISC